MIRRARNERGAVAVIVAFSMIVLLGVSALAIDLGYNYLQQRRLQAAVDYAVLAAAQDLPNATTATSDAQSYLNANWLHNGNSTDPSESLSTCPFNPSNPQVQCGSSSVTCPTNTPCQIHVSATASVPSLFGRIFGIGSTSVSAQGSACGGCSTAVQQYDVMIVMDRSFSMCLNSSGYDDCTALQAAKQGVLSLLEGPDFNSSDLVGLTVLSPADPQNIDHSTSCLVGTTCTGCAGTSGSPCNPPCDTINPSDYGVSGKGNFYGTLGDFMQGDSDTAQNTWVVAPLQQIKNADGTTYGQNTIIPAVSCLQAKWWTPMAPAIQAATNALEAAPSAGVHKIIIYEGDGGGDAQPMQINANGFPTQTPSWYTPLVSTENGVSGQYPCEDAVAQANLAKQAGITIYTIGYNLGASGADNCYDNNAYPNDIDSQSATTTLQDISGQGVGAPSAGPYFYPEATQSQLQSIFSTIGQQIVDSSTRITG